MKATANKETVKSSNHSAFFTVGNGAGFFGVQPKLNIGKPGDKYEQEADHVATRVVGKSTHENQNFFGGTNSFFGNSKSIQEKPISETVTPVVQLQKDEEEELQMKQDNLPEEEEIQMQPVEEEEELQMQSNEEEEEELQAKFIQKQNEEEEEMLQTFTEKPVLKNHSVEKGLISSSGNGNKMDKHTRVQMETGFGADFGNVKIHTDANSVQMNKKLGSQAFTHGNDIYFNEGKYDPASKKGKQLLAHELTHTLQQGASKSKTENGKSKKLNEQSEKTNFHESGAGQSEKGMQVTENSSGIQNTSKQVENQTKNIEKDTDSKFSGKVETGKLPVTQTSNKNGKGLNGKKGTSVANVPGHQDASQGVPLNNREGEKTIIGEEKQLETETAGGGGGAAPENIDANEPVRPAAAESLAKIASAPASVVKPYLEIEAFKIEADGYNSKQRVMQLALLRRISVHNYFINMQTRMISFFGIQQRSLQEFIFQKQAAVASTVMGAIAWVQGIIVNALQRGISLGNDFSELINGLIVSGTTSIQERVGGFVNQINGLINTVSLPDIPGVDFARNLLQNAVSRVAGVMQNALDNVVALIQGVFTIGMNLFNSFLSRFVSKVNLAFTLVSSVIMRILNMIFNLLNRVYNLVSLILGKTIFGTVFPLLDRLSSGVIRAINRKEKEAIHQIDVNTEQHLEALAEAVAPKADTGNGGGGGGGSSENSTPVTVGQFIAGIQQIGQSSFSNNRSIISDFNAKTSELTSLFIPAIINAVSMIISEIRNRIAAVITNVISIVVSVIQKIRILIDVLNVFITTLTQQFIFVVTRLVQFVISLVRNPVERLIGFAQRVISRITTFVSRVISNFVNGNLISFNLNSIAGNFSLSPATSITAPAFAGPPIQIIGGLVIIIIGGVAYAISTFTAAIILIAIVVFLLILLYLIYKWLTKPKLPVPPAPPPKPTGKEYDPGANFNIRYSVPLEKNDIQASAGEKLIFGVEASDQDRFRKIGTAAWTTISGTGPYEIVYKVKGDADLITSGSGKKSHTDPTLHSRNIFLFIKNAWTGKKITVTANVRDKAMPAAPPDVGTTKDTSHKITWTIIKRKNPCPTGLKRVAGPGSTWVSAPAVYTYLAMPEKNPPGRPNYEKQTVLESFANTTANNSFTMADLKTSWKAANPTLNTPDKVAVFLYGVSGNGTFVFNNQDKISDQHSGFGTTSPFKPAALNRASGVGYKKDQTYSCSTTSIGSAVIERMFSTVTGIRVKKTGP